MKRFLTYTQTALMGLILTAPLYAADLKQGFQGHKWETHPQGMPGLTKLWQKEQVSVYQNPQEIHRIGQLEVPHVAYGFYQDRFFAVYIKIEETELFGEVNNYLKSKYGMPAIKKSIKSDLTTYKWKHGKVKIKLKRYGQLEKVKLAFYYTPLSALVNESQQEERHFESVKFLPIEKDKRPAALPLLEF